MFFFSFLFCKNRTNHIYFRCALRADGVVGLSLFFFFFFFLIIFGNESSMKTKGVNCVFALSKVLVGS